MNRATIDSDDRAKLRSSLPERLPASTLSTSPVTIRVAPLSIMSAVRATSSASSSVPARGCLRFMYSRISSLLCARWLIGVRTNPGAIAFTRILCGA